MKTQLRLVLVSLLVGLSQHTLASPTANEFQHCDDMRDASFRYCMEAKAKLSPDEAACRTRSQEMKDACYRHVYDQYRKPSAAEREAQQRAMRGAQQRAAQAAP